MQPLSNRNHSNSKSVIYIQAEWVIAERLHAWGWKFQQFWLCWGSGDSKSWNRFFYTKSSYLISLERSSPAKCPPGNFHHLTFWWVMSWNTNLKLYLSLIFGLVVNTGVCVLAKDFWHDLFFLNAGVKRLLTLWWTLVELGLLSKAWFDIAILVKISQEEGKNILLFGP